MSAEPPTRALTKAEFEHLLQRAAERDVYREPRLFTLPELVAAGQEIGIDPISVEEVYAEYQQQVARPLRPVRPQPIGSHLQLDKRGDVLRLGIPPVRSRKLSTAAAVAATVPVAAVFWYLFGVFGAALPFVVMPVALVLYRLLGRTQTSGFELRLFRDGSGELVRLQGRKTTSYPLIAGQVQARLATVSDAAQGERFDIVALDHATKTHALMADFTHAERAWVVDENRELAGSLSACCR